MDSSENFEINYWGKDFENFYQEPQKHKRSFRQKLAIILSFIAVLALLPIIIFGLAEINSSKPQIATTISTKPEPTKAPLSKEKTKPKQIEATVISNDSYWKISKRYCGSGKYYLSIRDQNEGKPLFRNDVVRLSCAL